VTAWATGLRVGELLGCDVGALTTDAEGQGWLTVDGNVAYLRGAAPLTGGRAIGLTRQASAKTDRGHRAVAVPPFLIPILERFCDLTADRDTPLFPTSKGTYLSRSNFHRGMRRILVAGHGFPQGVRHRFPQVGVSLACASHEGRPGTSLM